jgi:predicted RNA-binding protein (virulence factor B family)
LGYNAIVNQRHVGLIYQNEIFEPLQIGDIKKGYVKKVREENKLDLSLQPIGYQHIIDAKARLLFILKANKGVLNLGDKSSPEEIYQKVKLSKKAFKKTIGGLYKDRLIEISDFAVKLL